MKDCLATVLYIEADHAYAYLFQYYLECAGYRVDIALTGSIGIDKIRQTSYDIIAIAQNLFDYSGLDIMRTIMNRSDSSNTLLPSMVMVAKRNNTRIAVQAMKLGAVDYFINNRDGQYAERLTSLFNRVIKERQQWMAKYQEEKERFEYMRQLESFSQIVAHDLKNPLSVILGFSDLLSGNYGEITEEEQREYIDLMHKNTIKMHDIVDALLMLARTKKMSDIALDSMNMDSIIHEVSQRTGPLQQDHNAIIEWPSSWPTAIGYGPWIEAIWVNYISNAIKYGGKPPIVRLGATELTDGMIRFWVQDNGSGLTEDQIKALFQPFKRLHGAEIQGTGLGLTIVQQIAKKLGGSVGVESTPGQGSKFWFTLPGQHRKFLEDRNSSEETSAAPSLGRLMDPSKIETAPLDLSNFAQNTRV